MSRKEYDREYYLRNKIRRLTQIEKYNEEHAEEIKAYRKEYMKKYYRENKQYFLDKQKHYRNEKRKEKRSIELEKGHAY
jgi:hypothetical protein